MITNGGVGVGVGGAGMLRARRRDVSIKPNRKLDRKSSRGMIYENEELRLRTIHINAEVEQGQNDIKKLKRENEQLRREIWCLREEYDKLEELLKSLKSRDGEEDSETDEDFSESESSSGSHREASEHTDEGENEEDVQGEEKEEDGKRQKEKRDEESQPIRDELLENAENQKLSTEKMNNAHRLYVEFDQLSTVAEEEETKKDKVSRKKDEGELIRGLESSEINEIEVKTKINKNKKEENYLTTTGGAFNWIYTGERSALPSVNDQSVYCPLVGSPSTQALINKNATQVPSLPSRIGWETIFDVKSCADSSSTVLPEGVTPSSSSENTGSTVIQKTSPDICVSGAVPSQLHNSHSSGNLLLNVRDDNLAKSHSCQELKSNLFREDNNKIKACIAAKSLPDNSRENCCPKAFRSQLRVQLCKPSQMAQPDCSLCQPPLDSSRHRRLMRQLETDDYQATSFEHPNPQNLTLQPPPPPPPPVSLNPRSDNKIYRDIGYLPVWADVPPLPSRVDTHTQTLTSSPTPSVSSEQDGRRKDDIKSSAKSTSEKKQKKTIMKKNERISTSSGETQQKKSKHSRNSELSKRRTSSRSQSATACTDIEPKNFRDNTIAGGIEAEKEFRKNSIANEKLPWCACWGNGCI